LLVLLLSPVCNWYGISCNNGGKVTSLSLTGYSLQGTLVSQLGQLTDLEDLVLTNCGLRGSIPKEIAALPELHVVDLSFNQLTGPVPIFAASSLTLLSLARNKLTGSIPPLLMGMPELITLDYKVRTKIRDNTYCMQGKAHSSCHDFFPFLV
jgi:Leucine-rich repeat (LRR) protein